MRRTAGSRLRRLLAELGDGADAAADGANGVGGPQAELEQQLESADASDIFAFIDNELGRAAS